MSALKSAPSEKCVDTKNFAYLDFDVNDNRAMFSRAAAFVYSTDLRYGWSSKDIRELGGSEHQRVVDMYNLDHDWSVI